MQVQFDQDNKKAKDDNRVKRRFRMTITANFIVEDDEHIDIECRPIDEEDIPTGEDDEDDADAMEAQGIYYDENECAYYQKRDIEADPVTIEEFADFLREGYNSTFEFIEEEDLEDKFTTEIVEIDVHGNDIPPRPGARNQSERS